MPRKTPTEAPTETQGDSGVAATETSEGAAPAKPMTKAQAMDAALAAGAGMPADGVAYVREHFGLDVSNKQFSTHKSLVRQKAAIDARDKLGKPATAVAATPAISARFEQPAKSAAKGPASPAELARTIKALVADHGAGAVGEMLDVFRE
jgi:hypothetical protein